MKSNGEYNGLEIAIIGISGSFPESDDCWKYWKNLCDGKELIKRFTDEDLIKSGVSTDKLGDSSYIKSEGVLNGKEYFDHGFFEYRPEEAALMDPQIRLFHEHTWKALEDAGCIEDIKKKKIGLFAGASENDNWKLYVYSQSNSSNINSFYLNIISNPRHLCSLVSYKLNLRGPSVFIDTACSTSLFAVDMACRNLITRECSIALAGGVCINNVKTKGFQYTEGMIESSDGHCRAFDKDANGTVVGEGIGVVVLKRLNDAISDRDHIYAIIKSSACNNDGNNKVGYTAPSIQGQAECIRMAHKLAEIDPNSISYVEAHGTGTLLGDPIEIRALNKAFGVGSGDKFCAIGSVKTNIGHLDTAAGIAGLIKTALSLKHKQIPASLHFKEANPEIDFAEGPFYVNTSLKKWERKEDKPLRAGLSSFGVGGTNVHLILEEAPDEEARDKGRNYKLLILSARTPESLSRQIKNLMNYLLEEVEVNLADMCYTMQVGRKHFQYRKSFVFREREELISLLESENYKDTIIKSRDTSNGIVFMFSGAGSQYANMGKGLYESEVLFREEMDKGFSLLKDLTGENYKEILFPKAAEDSRVNDIIHTQPLIFLFEYSLAQLLISYGVKPQYMIGHSIGEYVAACISGVFSYQNALRLVVKRGELMNSLPPGAMLSVTLKEEEAHKYLNDKISLAAVNAQEQVVFSGDVQSIDLLMNKLEGLDISFVKIHATIAAHSHLINGILTDYDKELNNVSMNSPAIPFISNVTGKIISLEDALSKEYWTRHMRETVRFSKGMNTLFSKNSEKIFIEIGGGNSLISIMKQQHFENAKPIGVNLIRHPKEIFDDAEYFLNQLGQMWSYGVNINWDSYYKEKRKKVSLPTYSFERIEFPTEVNPFENGLTMGSNFITVKENKGLKDWIYYPIWKSSKLTFSNLEVGEKRYAFFSPDNEFSASIKKELIKDKNELIEITTGDNFKKISRNKYVINPLDSEQYIELFNKLQQDKIIITDIIYSWTIGINTSKIELKEDDKILTLAYFAIVRIVQGLHVNNMLRDIRISVLTDSLHKVTNNEPSSYIQSLVLGVLNVLPQEHSLFCSNIDVSLKENSPKMVLDLCDEIRNNNQDRIVALRYGQRWLQDFQCHSSPLGSFNNLIKEDRLYLITGGLGDVGFILAKHLIKKYKAKIVLIGRKKITDDIRDIKQAKDVWLERLKYLTNLSNDVIYYSADVSNVDEFKKVIDDIEKNGGTINGVIHTAGVTDQSWFEYIEDITFKKTLEMFAPKVKGIENIYQIFGHKNLDFVWVTSSLATVLGGLGFCSYSSANLYMDYFITSKSKELPNWKCVDLAEMLFKETDIENEDKNNRKALTPDDICELFETSLSIKDQPVIMETVIDLYSRLHKVFFAVKKLYLDKESYSAKVKKIERPNLKSNYLAPDTGTEITLVNMIEDFFGIQNIGIEDDFLELGGDSLKAMAFLKRIRKDFNVNLSLKDFFGNLRIKELAAEIDQKIWLKKDINFSKEIKI